MRLGIGGIGIYIENEALEGVKRIGQRLADDIELVCGKRPVVVSDPWKAVSAKGLIICATLGKSPLLEELNRQGLVDTSLIEGKREVFHLRFVEGIKIEGCEVSNPVLLIAGSDKRGTIYGMFTLSEYLGVTPMVYFGDAAPAVWPEAEVAADICQTSKEPSVKYRGFFINDEWPCFGNWVCEHFGGFNAKAYDYVFEFLLRMKGNYLWPAMWSASFPLDGPGSANEELADMYGVVMGYSHHEPCLRASEEWDKVRGEGTKYGNEWNYATNTQGLLNYWEDALIRSGKYENLITIGMRGERDTSMLGEDATMADNVELLKEIITNQRRLIDKHVKREGQVPMLLALYKEVEAYFYGDEKVPGLKHWDGLDGVTCMFCEDNFGQMRTLPTEDIRDREGGFGMYYHFDYHGGPISYEWVDSTPMVKTWEQMCTAYEHGVSEVWIVNVGDLKFHEVPLSYFLALAYDFDKWGSSNLNSAKEYVAKWTEKVFTDGCKHGLGKDIAKVLTQYISLNHIRRPESLNEYVFSPCHYGEADEMLAKVEQIEDLSNQIFENLCDREKDAYYSMIHYSVIASANLWKMHLYAGKNRHYAMQGKTIANQYGELVEQCILRDRGLIDQWKRFKQGKWNGMQLASHVGFTRWNEDDCRYPVIAKVWPISKPRVVVSRADEAFTATKTYGPPMTLNLWDFTNPDTTEVKVEIANAGEGNFAYEIIAQGREWPKWLKASSVKGTVTKQETISFFFDKTQMEKEKDQCRLLVKALDTVVALDVKAKIWDLSSFEKGTSLPDDGVIVIDADQYIRKQDTAKGSFYRIDGYGNYGVAMKVAPSTAAFGETDAKPALTYQFWLEQEGDYLVECLCAPTNPSSSGTAMHLSLSDGAGKQKILEMVPADFCAGDTKDPRWCKGVLDQVRIVSTTWQFDAGVQNISVSPLETGLVFERLRIYPADKKLKQSYLGPKTSCRA